MTEWIRLEVENGWVKINADKISAIWISNNPQPPTHIPLTLVGSNVDTYVKNTPHNRALLEIV